MGKSKGKLKADKNKSEHFIIDEPEDYNMMTPLFSLERLQSGDYCLSKLEKDDKAAFADAIFKRRNSTWNQIQQMSRHGLGHEKIDVTSIKVAIPKFITEDEHNLLAFRYSGKKPMIGYRIKNIFYILWFDHNFTIYDHGS